MTDYHVYSTDDLVNWQDHGVVLDVKNVPWAESHMWAPDCNKIGETYYFVFCPRPKAPLKGRPIGVATGKSPAGPFVPATQPIADCNGIDPSLFIDDDGTPYLFWAGAGCEVAKIEAGPERVRRAADEDRGAEELLRGAVRLQARRQILPDLSREDERRLGRWRARAVVRLCHRRFRARPLQLSRALLALRRRGGQHARLATRVERQVVRLRPRHQALARRQERPASNDLFASTR